MAGPLLRFLRDVATDPVLAKAANDDLDAATQGRGLSDDHMGALRSADHGRISDEIRKEAGITPPAQSAAAYSVVSLLGLKLNLDDIKL